MGSNVNFDQAKTWFYIMAYSFCSSTMLLFNKLALSYIALPSVVTLLQITFATIVIAVLMWANVLPRDYLDAQKTRVYTINTALFIFGIYCNMRSLAVANVETVIIFRSCSPLAVSLCDWLFLNRELPSLRSLLALVTIGTGAIAYLSADVDFRVKGLHAYFWPALYFIMICAEMTYGKVLMSSLSFNSMWGPTLYTNLFAIAPALLLAYASDDLHKLTHMQWSWNGAAGSVLFMSSVAGTFIGYTSWTCRKLLSATSFTVVGIMNKFATIFLNTIMWSKHADAFGIASLVLALIGGCFYQQAPLQTDHCRLEVQSADARLEHTPLVNDALSGQEKDAE